MGLNAIANLDLRRQPRDAYGRFCKAAVDRGRDGIRGKDRAKLADWVGLDIVHEFEDGTYIANFVEKADLVALGRMGGGCSGDHKWTIEQGHEFIMAVMDSAHVPHCIMHWAALDVAWMNVPNKTQWDTVYSNVAYCFSIVEPKQPRKWWKGQHLEKYDSRYWARNVDSLKGDLAYYSECYEGQKKRALDAGPLGPDNPYKADMDYFNRLKSECEQAIKRDTLRYEQALEEEKQEKATKPERTQCWTEGRQVYFRGKHIFPISIRHADKWAEYASEWLDTLPDGKDIPIPHIALKEPLVCKTITELNDAVAATNHPQFFTRARTRGF